MLAGLLAGGHIGVTALTPVKDRPFVDDAGRRIRLETYATDRICSAWTIKSGVVFTFFNTSAEPLEFSAVRGFSGLGEHVSLAFRVQPR